MKTEQIDFWTNSFGSEYTERNKMDVQEQDDFYVNEYGVSRTEMNRRFLDGVSIDKILEVGCNVGNQLRCLQNMGFSSIYGIDLQSYAVERAKQLTKGLNIIQGSAFDLPFKDNYFDLVFTTGVLIHIAPSDIGEAMDEMYRVSGKYIWGFEYFNESYSEIDYRGNRDKLWKADFKQLFLDRFPSLRLVREESFKYTQNENIDQMYLLEKN